MATIRRYRVAVGVYESYEACDKERCKARVHFKCGECGQDVCFSHVYRPSVAWRKATLYGDRYFCIDCVEAILLRYAESKSSVSV